MHNRHGMYYLKNGDLYRLSGYDEDKGKQWILRYRKIHHNIVWEYYNKEDWLA